MVDGKDFLIHTPRAHTAVTRACRSNKMKASAVRCLTWVTASGLVFEYTPPFLARLTEERLVELWGSEDDTV